MGNRQAILIRRFIKVLLPSPDPKVRRAKARRVTWEEVTYRFGPQTR